MSGVLLLRNSTEVSPAYFDSMFAVLPKGFTTSPDFKEAFVFSSPFK